MEHKSLLRNPPIPQTPVGKVSRPFINFLHIEASGGVVLLICTILALFFANSPFADAYMHFWHIPISFKVGGAELSHSLGHWINDGLMTIFFFVVGLEIKRELISGELKDRRAAALPALAALGGMIVPALIYTLVLGGRLGKEGWGIPMATDIAFVVGFLSLLGKRVPHGLKIFLLSLAIVDDLGAVIVIAVFYSANISIAALAIGIMLLAVIVFLNRIGVRRIPVYLVVGSFVWFAFLLSGIHPTIAGVALGLLTPASAWIGDKALVDVVNELREKWSSKTAKLKEERNGDVKTLVYTARETVSPLERLETSLHPWVAFFIMPVFALCNAAVPLQIDAATSAISISVALGLFLGKPIGIVLFSWLATKTLGAKLPPRVNWLNMCGAGVMGGIGFTMSIFIAGLALDGTHLVEGKVGTLTGSILSSVVGLAILAVTLPRSNGERA